MIKQAYKKAVFLFAAAILCVSFGFAAVPTRSGEYVIYRDYSWNTPTWVGFLQYDENTYGAFLYTPEKEARVSMLFSTKQSGNKMELIGQRIISSITQDDVETVNYLMFLLPDLYRLQQDAAHRSEAVPSIQKTVLTSGQFGGSVTVSFFSPIPLFGIKAIADAQARTMLDCTYIGMISQTDDSPFFRFVPHVEKKEDAGCTLRTNPKTQDIMVDGITLHLDEQWKMIADNSFLMGNTAFLTVNTIDPVVFSPNPADIPTAIIRFFSRSGKNTLVCLDTQTVSYASNILTVTNTVYDKVTEKLSTDIKYCKKNKEGTYTMVSLTVADAVYAKYSRYFEALF